MPDTTDIQILKAEYTAAEQAFQRFFNYREKWIQLLDREMPITLSPAVTGVQQQVLEYQSPDIEKWMFDHVDVLQRNPTEFDVMVRSKKPRAKEWARDWLLVAADLWEHLDKDRWWDAKTGEDQIKYGVSGCKLNWNAYTKPEGDEEYARPEQSFSLVDCETLGLKWMGNDKDPDVVFYKYDMPILAAFKEITNSEGKHVSLDDAKKIYWAGEHELPDKSAWTETITVLVRDAADPKRKCPLSGCDHAIRVITEYVMKGDNFEEAQEAHSYDSPFHLASFFITGGRVSNAHDPHLRFRPYLYPAYVEMIWYNYLRTTLANAALRDSAERLYIRADLAKAAGVALPEGGIPESLPRPDPNAAEIPYVYGEVLSFPSAASPHFVALLDESRQKLAQYAPNPWIIGTALEKAGDTTASLGLDQHQQARLPYDRMLSQSDGTILRIFEAIRHAMLFWAYTNPDLRYGTLTTGRENVMSGKVEAGQPAWVNAEKLDISADLILKTESATLEEQQKRYLLKERQYDKGWALEDDVIQAAGNRDVQTFKERKYAELIQSRLRQQERMLVDMTMTYIIQVKTGINFGAIQQMAGAQQQSAPPAQGGQQPEREPAGATQITGRQMQTPMVEGPSGGASPVGGT